MTEKGIFRETNGNGDGSAFYTEAELTTWVQDLFGDAVVRGVGGELEVTGSASPLSVADGRCHVRGVAYFSTAVENLAVPTPVVGDTGHLVVVRVEQSPSINTTRLALLSATDGISTPPSPVQDATYYDLPLAEVLADTGGGLVVTDVRAFTSPTGVTAGKAGAVFFQAGNFSNINSFPENLDEISSGFGRMPENLDPSKPMTIHFVGVVDGAGDMAYNVLGISRLPIDQPTETIFADITLFAPFPTVTFTTANQATKFFTINVPADTAGVEPLAGEIVSFSFGRKGTEASDTAGNLSFAGVLIEYTEL